MDDNKKVSPNKNQNNLEKTNINKQYISIENNNKTKKKIFKYKNKKYNADIKKSFSSNVLHCSTLDTSINFTTNNFNTLNRSIINKDTITTNPNLNSKNKLNKKNRPKDSICTFEELNKKFHSLKVDQRRRGKSLTNFKGCKNTFRNLSNINNIFCNHIKRTTSHSKLICKTINPLDININDNLNNFNYNNFYLKTHNIIYNNKYLNKDSKTDYLKTKINNLINDYDTKITPNKMPSNNSYKNFKTYKSLYNKSNYNDLNILNNKENDIKKFNIFAISKVMDLNDIKTINKSNNNFYDYNYNRNYSKKINNIYLENKINSIISKGTHFNQSNYKNKKKIDEYFQYLK